MSGVVLPVDVTMRLVQTLGRWAGTVLLLSGLCSLLDLGWGGAGVGSDWASVPGERRGDRANYFVDGDEFEYSQGQSLLSQS